MDLTILNSFAVLMTYVEVRTGIVLFAGLVLAIALHEFGHAAAAVWLGDPTPRNPGRSLSSLDALGELMGVGRGRTNRYTVNPLAHADPIGTVALPLMATFVLPGAMLFGWGRPVPFNPNAPRRRVSLKQMIIMVSLAGPMSNVIQAMVWSGLLVAAVALGAGRSDSEILRSLVTGALPGLELGWLQLLVGLNFLLAVFNLLPVPPLDGGHILVSVIGRQHPDWARWLEQYGLFLFLLLLPVLPLLFAPVQELSLGWTRLLVGAAGG
ncbi:MAG: site-2 protease family protein [Polyangia bacterium]|jgi:Zn-dependent protease|nr:site-2 protease family protein [Polyangia bacterium]